MSKSKKPLPATAVSPFRDDFSEQTTTVLRRLLPDTDVSSIPLFGVANTVGRLLNTFNDQNLKPFACSYTEYLVLGMLRTTSDGKGLSPTVLNDILMQTSGGLTQTIKRLEQAGFISRAPNPEDGRSVIVELTRAGEDLADRMLAAQAEAQNQKLAWLDESQRQQLLESLQLMVKLFR
ncbi:MAG: MarR family transcriptional regulator [Halioglobus sp.]